MIRHWVINPWDLGVFCTLRGYAMEPGWASDVLFARSMEAEGVVGTQQRYSRATLTSYSVGGNITHSIAIDCVRTFF